MSYDIQDRYPLDPETCVHDKALSRKGRCGMCGISLEDSEASPRTRMFSQAQLDYIRRMEREEDAEAAYEVQQ